VRSLVDGDFLDASEFGVDNSVSDATDLSSSDSSDHARSNSVELLSGDALVGSLVPGVFDASGFGVPVLAADASELGGLLGEFLGPESADLSDESGSVGGLDPSDESGSSLEVGESSSGDLSDDSSLLGPNNSLNGTTSLEGGSLGGGSSGGDSSSDRSGLSGGGSSSGDESLLGDVPESLEVLEVKLSESEVVAASGGTDPLEGVSPDSSELSKFVETDDVSSSSGLELSDP